MKLYEEFEEYETLWDDEDEDTEPGFYTSFIKTVKGKDYDLTKADELRAALEAANDDLKAMHLKNIIYDNERGKFSEETIAMALRVWREYKRDHGLN